MVFYVKGKTCLVAEERISSGSLKKYANQTDSVCIQHQKEALFFDLKGSLDVQIIPLAGKGCYWEADFLVAFYLFPHQKNALSLRYVAEFS